ncbi:MAG: sulfotransferase [Bacteroidota bacterium]
MDIIKTKVFIIGFHKTGTTSLEEALKNLGYRVYGGDKHLLDFKSKSRLQEYLKKKTLNWDAVQDMPWPLVFKDLYEIYPEAKFILTKRETDNWIRSVVKYFARIRIPLHRKIYNVPCAEGHEKRYVEVYENHNREVLEFFNNKPNFLMMEQGKNFDYKTLCNFLDIAQIPSGDFPHARNNKKRTLPNYKIYRDLRSLYWNFKKRY